jgi:hypothetical protein
VLSFNFLVELQAAVAESHSRQCQQELMELDHVARISPSVGCFDWLCIREVEAGDHICRHCCRDLFATLLIRDHVNGRQIELLFATTRID